jgi:hypothetical protein
MLTALFIWTAALAAGLVALTVYSFRPAYPAGKRFVYRHENFKAVVIVEDSITCYGNGFIVGGYEKIDGQALARACALSMKAVSETMKGHPPWSGIKPENTWGNTCVFNFLGTQSFNQRAALEGHKEFPDLAAAYTCPLNRKLIKLPPACPMTVIRSNNMSAIVKKGQKAIHELVHVYAYAFYGTWDSDHLLWTSHDLLFEGKTQEKMARDRWIVLNNQQ